MKSLFRATAILSGSSVINILIGMISAKTMAVVLQPIGYGYYGLLQSFVAIASLVTGLGMSTGLVRAGAAAIQQGDQRIIAGLRRAAWWLFAGLGLLALALMAMLQSQLGSWVLGSSEQGNSIMWMGIALLFTVAAQVQNGLLNAYHRVADLAKCSIVTSVLSAIAAVISVVIWRADGVVPAIIGAAAVSWLVSGYFVRYSLGPAPVRATFDETRDAAWSLLRFGGSFTASVMIGNGVQMAMPILVMHMVGGESVGYYKASVAISVGYLGFLVTAMSQDYYPRISAVKDQPEALVKLVNEQHRLVMILAAPIILGMLACAPYLIELIYSAKFAPTAEILEWQLIGDLFKFSSWTMSFVVLARCRSSVYFFIEAIGGLAGLGTLWVCVRWYGLAGLGISFLLAYVIYYLVVWIVVRREIGLVWTSSNKKMMWSALAGALFIRILPSLGLGPFRVVVAAVLTSIAGAFSLRVIWSEMKTRKEASATP